MLKTILQTLVAFPTVTGNQVASEQALAYIKHFIEERGMQTTYFESNGFSSLIAATKSLKKPKVLLCAHLDVVPASSELFTLREENGKLYGRGVLDMKFAIACYLQLIDDLKNNLQDYDFGLMITTDEELGGQHGVESLVEQGYLPEVCILPDGGDNWQIQLHSKGVLHLKLSHAGKTAHGSRPWLGENSIKTLLGALHDIHELIPKSSIDSNSFNVGTFKGGNAINQVADYAEAGIDIRLMSESDRAHILESIYTICNNYNVKVDILLNGAVTSFELSNSYIKPFAELITEITGVEVVGSHTLGTNDARFFAAYNIPCISFYPTGGGHHGPEEWITELSLEQSKAIIQRYVQLVAATKK